MPVYEIVHPYEPLSSCEPKQKKAAAEVYNDMNSYPNAISQKHYVVWGRVEDDRQVWASRWDWSRGTV